MSIRVNVSSNTPVLSFNLPKPLNFDVHRMCVSYFAAGGINGGTPPLALNLCLLPSGSGVQPDGGSKQYFNGVESDRRVLATAKLASSGVEVSIANYKYWSSSGNDAHSIERVNTIGTINLLVTDALGNDLPPFYSLGFCATIEFY